MIESGTYLIELEPEYAEILAEENYDFSKDEILNIIGSIINRELGINESRENLYSELSFMLRSDKYSPELLELFTNLEYLLGIYSVNAALVTILSHFDPNLRS